MFVSYAQNLEDVMLWRALKHIKNGFYVDIGAQQPRADSVTHAFYQRGWSGINAEPSPEYFKALCRARPRDVNIPKAVSNVEGSTAFYVVKETGLSTLEAEFAANLEKSGYTIETARMETTTLKRLLAEHAKKDIHFLKIDVEGHEANVLASADFQNHRPWIVLVEATTPNSTDVQSQSWEPSLLDARYRPVYFDGLNKFYVAEERLDELGGAFQSPPNVFDNYVRHYEADIRAMLSRLDADEALDKTLFLDKPGKLAVDLTPLRPGGENGGIKRYIYSVLPWLRNRLSPGSHFVFLTSSLTHDLVRSELASELDEIVCVVRDPSKQVSLDVARREKVLWDAAPDFLLKLNCDLLYCPFGAVNFATPGIPTVALVVDLLHLDYPDSLPAEEVRNREAYITRTVNEADAIQCISDYVVKRISQSYPETNVPLFRTYLPVPPPKFPSQPEAAANLPGKYFFYPANFWKHKNHENLLAAYALYARQAGEGAWHLVLTGHGDEGTLAQIRSQLGASDLERLVHLKGFLSEEEMARTWQKAGALIFPSLHEGFGIPLLEAMSYGVPIITGLTTCLQEVAGNAALYADCTNPGDLAKAMSEMATSLDRQELLRKNGKERLRVFDFDLENRKLADSLYALRNSRQTRKTVKGIEADGTCPGRALANVAGLGKGTLSIRIASAHPEPIGVRFHVDECFFGTLPLSAGEPREFTVPIEENARTLQVNLHRLQKKRIDPAATATVTIHRIEFSPVDGGQAIALFENPPAS